jgi:Mrp family chromosome partitioning ATPase
MSRIFDALQRSEAERSGMKPAALDATELLRHAEHRAATEWEAGTPAEPAAVAPLDRDAVRTADIDPPVRPVTPASSVSPVPSVSSRARGARGKTATAAEAVVPRDLPEIFTGFKPLKISVPSYGRLVSISDRDSAAAEAFRLLAVRLRHLRRDRPLQKVLITSSSPQEGKSTCSTNLACSLALRAQQRVLLIEGDIRRPGISQMFSISQRPGVCEWLREERQLAETIYYLEGPGLWYMPAGSSPANPLEMLQSGRPGVLLDQLVAPVGRHPAGGASGSIGEAEAAENAGCDRVAKADRRAPELLYQRAGYGLLLQPAVGVAAGLRQGAGFCNLTTIPRHL